MNPAYTPQLLPGAEHWCQRWRRGQHSWRHTSDGGFDPARYTVVPLRTTPVAHFIQRHHYSRSRASTVLGYVLIDLWPDHDPDAQWLDLENLRTTSLPIPAPSHQRGQIVGALTLGNPMNKHTLPGVFPHLVPPTGKPWNSTAWSCSTASWRPRSRGSAPERFDSPPARPTGSAGLQRIRSAGTASCPPAKPRSSPRTLRRRLRRTDRAAAAAGPGRRAVLLPDGTTLVGRTQQDHRRGAWGAGVVNRLVKLGAVPARPARGTVRLARRGIARPRRRRVPAPRQLQVRVPDRPAPSAPAHPRRRRRRRALPHVHRTIDPDPHRAGPMNATSRWSWPVVLNLGMGVDSVSILTRWAHEHGSRNFDLGQLVIVTSMTGEEHDDTAQAMTDHVLPLMRSYGLRYAQISRAGQSASAGIAVLSDTRRPTRMHMRGPWALSDELTASGTLRPVARRACSQRAKGDVIDRWLADRFTDIPYLHVKGYRIDLCRWF